MTKPYKSCQDGEALSGSDADFKFKGCDQIRQRNLWLSWLPNTGDKKMSEYDVVKPLCLLKTACSDGFIFGQARHLKER
jgi:hypothetical protein